MRLELHKKSNRQLAFIENTMIVCNAQNPCVSTCLSHAVLSKTQPPMQSIGSSSLWPWSPKNLDYSTNSHLGSCCLLTLLSIGFPRAHTMSSPQPTLHIFNLYLLLIVKPMHLLCSLPSAGSLRGSSGGVIGGGQSVLLSLFFQITVLRKRQWVCFSAQDTCVYTHMPLDVFDLVSTRHDLFTMVSVYMDQRSSGLALD